MLEIKGIMKLKNYYYTIMVLFFLGCKDDLAESMSKEIGNTDIKENVALRDSILNEIRSYVTMHNCPGLSVAFTLDGKKYTKYNYGWKDKDAGGTMIDNKTLYRIGSVSKGFTGILASILINKGYFKLTDPVMKYIPECRLKAKDKKDSIRIWHVLAHCTGLTEHAYSNLIEQKFTREKILNNLFSATVRDSTGKKYAYQNATFGIVEAIIEKTTKMSFEEALQNFIFTPLKMDSTNVGYTSLVTSINHAKPHRISSSGRYSSFTADEAYYNIPSAGGLNSTLNDMTLWLRTLVNDGNHIISKEAVDMALQTYVDSSWDDRYFNKWKEVSNSGYGLGWRKITFNGEAMSFHGGQVNQYRTEIIFNRKRKYGMVALFNSTCGYTSEIVPHVIGLIQEGLEEQNCL
ncbi:MAG: hypothetical protein RLZZ546_1250 [Bacteroidota bacterium]